MKSAGDHNQETWPSSITDYDVQRKIGLGSFATVAVARCRNLNLTVAIKMMRKSDIVKRQRINQARQEVVALKMAKSRYVVQMYTAFQDRKILYIVLEYMRGGEIYTFMCKHGVFKVPAEIASAQYMAASLILGLEYLHSKSIVYRDMKPENILLDERGCIKLADFGLAKIIQDKTYTLCGTPEYLAPEVIKSKGYGLSVDWWSLGIILYECFLGNTPFSDKEPMVLYEKILTRRIFYPPILTKPIVSLLKGLCAHDLSKRLGGDNSSVDQIKNHEFFENFDWKKFESGDMESPIKLDLLDKNTGIGTDAMPEMNQKPNDSVEESGEIETYFDLFPEYEVHDDM